MKSITITIKTSGAAFAESPGEEVARILYEVASEIASIDDPLESGIMDINGNTVGKLVIR